MKRLRLALGLAAKHEEGESESEAEKLVQALVAQLPGEPLSDLHCALCNCVLHDPWTLGSGRTVCKPCIPRVTGEIVTPAANGIIARLVEFCLPRAAEAGLRRHDGNKHFRQGELRQAVDAYSAALQLDESAAAFANRSAAHLKLKNNEEALQDALRASELRPTWDKAQLRLAAALRENGRHAEALGPLLRALALGHAAETELVEVIKLGNALPPLESVKFPKPPAARRISAQEVRKVRQELECCLCYQLLCEPTILPCGHCMCRDCVARTLDHALQTEPSCPLCRETLLPLLQRVNRRAREQLREGNCFAHCAAQLTVCIELARLLQDWFPDEYAERLSEVRAPQSEWVPIFVCSLSAPFLPTPLHIFEPRYRLMMRRCIESNQRFGMCLPTEDGFADSGTMLFIDRFEQLPDGRSLVGTKGLSRFSVINRGTLDGYSTALIRPFEEDAQGFPSSKAFHTEALALLEGVQKMHCAIQPDALERLEHQLGPLPSPDSPHFDAHVGFYAVQFLSSIGAMDSEASDLVFLQPESERWQKLLQRCANFGPFGEELRKKISGCHDEAADEAIGKEEEFEPPEEDQDEDE